ncbi:MAG TPA: hypothetical protein VNR65_10065, partial [Geobacterales bacterium]|nr:hypothetical protein [Geobacterales bacterium]
SASKRFATKGFLMNQTHHGRGTEMWGRPAASLKLQHHWALASRTVLLNPFSIAGRERYRTLSHRWKPMGER